MWRVLLLVFCYHVVSQAEDESTRHTRELIECCPCPGSSLPSDLIRQRTPDDCPCQSRSADSEGASSMLFPSRTASPKNSVPFMRSNDPNDMKNLLEPEVGLAKSMLQTLREATEEEYRDALARDAARSSDAVPEESARNVVIIVKPRASDDEDLFVPEASNVKETQIINPLSSLGQMRTVSKPLRTLPDLFRFPKPRPNLTHRNVWDMDSNVGASNVQPSVVGIDLADSKRLPLFKFRTPLKENPLRSSNNNGLKTPSVLKQLEGTFKNRPNLLKRFNLPQVPKMKVDSQLGNNNNVNTDLSSAPSNNKEFIEKENDEGFFKINKRPPLFKNLYKLKDVELIPKTIPKLPILKSKLDTDKELTQPIPLNRDVDDTCGDSNYDSAMNEKVLMPKQVSSKDSFVDKNVPDLDLSLEEAADTVVKPEVDQADAVTSPSELIPSIVDKNIEESHETDCNDVTSEEMRTATEGISQVLADDGSNEPLNHAVESEIDYTGNDNENLNKNFKAGEVSDGKNQVSDPDTDGSINIVNVIPSDDQEDSISLQQLEKFEKDVNLSEDDNKDFLSLRSSEDESVNEPYTEIINKKIIPNIKPISSLSKTLSTIKENVKMSLESLKKASKNVIPPLSSENGKNSNLRINTPINNDQEPQIIKETNADSKEKENEDNVTFNDLQKLSDDLLVMSSNNKQIFTPKEAETEVELNNADFKSNADQQQIVENEPDSLEIGTSTSITGDALMNNDVKTTSSKGKTSGVGFDEKEIKRKSVQPNTETDEDNKDMSVEANAPKPVTLPTLLDSETEDELNNGDFKSNAVQQQIVENEPDSLEIGTSTSITDDALMNNDVKTTSSKGKTSDVGFDVKEIKRKSVQPNTETDEDNEDMSVEASAPKAVTLPILLDSETEDELNNADFKLNADQQHIEENEPDSLEIGTSTSITGDALMNNDVKTTSSKGKAYRVGFDENKTKRKSVQPNTETDEDNKDMSVEASAPRAITLPTLLDFESEDELNNADFKSNADQQQIVENEPDSLEIGMPTSITGDTLMNNDVKTTSLKRKACGIGFDEKETKRKSVQQNTKTDENNKDMSVEASAPKAITLPTLLDSLNLNEQLGSSGLNEKLRSSLLPNLDPLNLNEKLRSPVFSDPLNLSEKLSSHTLPNLDPLNLNLGSPTLDPLNLNEKLSLFQPNLDPLNVRSSLQDIVVQPIIPDDPLNILNKPIAEVLKLPTLEDLRQRLSDVFDSNDRSAENYFSDEDSDCTNDSPVEMAHAASTNSIRKVPTLRPLENMNVDIFQLNPLSNPDLLSNAPRLNLNNFRTKLPIPNNLDLKPVKLESRVTNNKGNVLGASLSFGNDKTLRKAKPNSNKLSHSLGGLPSLDELRNTLQSSTQNLLGNPLHSKLDLFRDSSLRASGIPDIDEIRRNAEKTMKGLQQRMKSTFKGGKISNPLGEKFARPQDLLEDMNDKLKAIHYDLNDRLSSIHEDILDQTRINPLAISLPATSTNRNSNHNKVNNIWKPKGKPSRLQTSASTISSVEMDRLENTNDRNLLRSSAKNSPKRIQSNTHRTLLGAESSPVASKVEFPKHKTILDTPSKSTLPPLLRLPSSRQGSENAFPTTIGKPLVLPRQPTFVKDLKRPILRKPNPFKDKTNKVTITFTTTTASPVISPMNTGSYITPPLKQNKPDIVKHNGNSLNERLALPSMKPIDAKQSASNIQPNVLSSVKSKNNFKTAISDKDLPQPQNVEPINHTKTRVPSFKETKDRLNENTSKKLSLPWSDKIAENNFEVLKEKSNAKPLVWPKNGEDSFLAKVREAMQARLNNFNPVKPAEKEETSKVESNTDMLKSASENQDIVVADEPLKENVSYRCRMVCTRE